MKQIGWPYKQRRSRVVPWRVLLILGIAAAAILKVWQILQEVKL